MFLVGSVRNILAKPAQRTKVNSKVFRLPHRPTLHCVYLRQETKIWRSLHIFFDFIQVCAKSLNRGKSRKFATFRGISQQFATFRGNLRQFTSVRSRWLDRRSLCVNFNNGMSVTLFKSNYKLMNIKSFSQTRPVFEASNMI